MHAVDTVSTGQQPGLLPVLLPIPRLHPPPACCLQGKLEMLQLGGMGLTGGVPACLFAGNSSLYQLGLQNNQLEGALPNAFATASRLQMLNLAGVGG